jgi:hypothetical protein
MDNIYITVTKDHEHDGIKRATIYTHLTDQTFRVESALRVKPFRLNDPVMFSLSPNGNEYNKMTIDIFAEGKTISGKSTLLQSLTIAAKRYSKLLSFLDHVFPKQEETTLTMIKSVLFCGKISIRNKTYHVMVTFSVRMLQITYPYCYYMSYDDFIRMQENRGGFEYERTCRVMPVRKSTVRTLVDVCTNVSFDKTLSRDYQISLIDVTTNKLFNGHSSVVLIKKPRRTHYQLTTTSYKEITRFHSDILRLVRCLMRDYADEITIQSVALSINRSGVEEVIDLADHPTELRIKRDTCSTLMGMLAKNTECLPSFSDVWFRAAIRDSLDVSFIEKLCVEDDNWLLTKDFTASPKQYLLRNLVNYLHLSVIDTYNSFLRWNKYNHGSNDVIKKMLIFDRVSVYTLVVCMKVHIDGDFFIPSDLLKIILDYLMNNTIDYLSASRYYVE